MTGAAAESLQNLGVLITVNAVLGALQLAVAGSPPMVTWVVLFGVANIVHLALGIPNRETGR